MDGSVFDRWTKSFVVGVSRRAAVRTLFGASLAAGIARWRGLSVDEEAAAICLPGESCNCTPVGAACSRDGQCCSDLCLNNGKCGCGSIGARCRKDKNCCAGATCDRGACVPITNYQFLRAWELAEPMDVAVDDTGHVYATDQSTHRVVKFTSQGDLLASWGGEGKGDGQFSFPWGIAVDWGPSWPDRVYVTDFSPRVQVFSSNGDFLAAWGSEGSGDGEFQGPIGVAIDKTRHIYVADRYKDQIQKIHRRGFVLLAAWGSEGDGNGQFAFPHGVAVHGAKVYVTDEENDRIQQFSTDGTYLLQWGGPGSGNGTFNHPIGVAVDQAGSVYVADTENHRIQKFHDDVYVAKFGGFGNGNGQFNTPLGVAVDLGGRVYVADWGNNRIQVFKPA